MGVRLALAGSEGKGGKQGKAAGRGMAKRQAKWLVTKRPAQATEAGQESESGRDV